MTPTQNKYKYLEDGQEKVCIERIGSDGTQWLTRMKANVATYSFHLISKSDGELFIHKDSLSGDGRKTGSIESLSCMKHRIVNVSERLMLSPSHKKSDIVIFPLTNDIEIVSSGSDKIVESKGKGEILVVDCCL